MIARKCADPELNGKSAVFLIESALTSHGSSKSNKKPSDGRGISDYIQTSHSSPVNLQKTRNKLQNCVLFMLFISSPGPKDHGNYCHHFASVVCKLFTFQASSPKPLGHSVLSRTEKGHDIYFFLKGHFVCRIYQKGHIEKIGQVGR